jgi:transcriptional regulator with XRE-family HTH domain
MHGGRPPKSTQRTAFGKRLYNARIEKGLSQAYVAGQLGITQPSYADWERKAISLKPEYLPMLAELLDVSVEQLLGSTASKQRKGGGPTGKLRRVFDQVSELPHSQQRRIISIVEDMLIAQKTKKVGSSPH